MEEKSNTRSWPTAKLAEVVEINPRLGDDIFADDMLASFVPMKCVEEESGRFTPVEDREVKDVRKGYTPFRDGDVLFAKVTPCMENGKAAIVQGLTNGIGFGSTELFALRPARNLLQKFLFFFIIQESFRRSAAANMTGAVGLRRVPKSYLAEQIIPLPPLPDQRRIVAEIEKQFTRLDAGVAALRRTQANLKRYRAAVLKAACEGRLVPTEAELARNEALFGGSISEQDFGSPSHGSNPSINRGSIPRKEVQRSNLIGSTNYETGEQLLARILTERRQNWNGRGKYKEPSSPDMSKFSPLPEGWTWASSEQSTSLVTSGSRGWGEFYSDTGPIFIRAQDIKTDSLKLEGVARVSLPAKAEGMRSSVENSDLLITITGANVTRSAIVHGLLEVAFVSQHVALLKPVCREVAAFHYLWIISPTHGRKFLEKWAYGAGKPGLSLEQVRGLPIALPPLAEQRRIVAEVERRLSVVDELETIVTANLQRASIVRQSILQMAFAGKLA